MEKIINELKNEIFEDQEIVKFIRKHKITEEAFIKNITLFYLQKRTNDICNNCLGKKPCALEEEEMQSELIYHHGNISRKYFPCKYLDKINEDFFELHFFPNLEIVGKLYDSPARAEIIRAINEFLKDPLNNKGFYLHGPFGTGKTFILLQVAKQLTIKRYKVAFVYYPDLVRYIKSSITNNKVEEIVEKLKTAEILMLDDFGGENNTNFIRDEVLGPILQYRMLGNKPTFMTSNFNLNILHQHLTETKTDVDHLKSSRIIERIKFMMNIYELKDKNYRL